MLNFCHINIAHNKELHNKALDCKIVIQVIQGHEVALDQKADWKSLPLIVQRPCQYLQDVLKTRRGFSYTIVFKHPFLCACVYILYVAHI